MLKIAQTFVKGTPISPNISYSSLAMYGIRSETVLSSLKYACTEAETQKKVTMNPLKTIKISYKEQRDQKVLWNNYTPLITIYVIICNKAEPYKAKSIKTIWSF